MEALEQAQARPLPSKGESPPHFADVHLHRFGLKTHWVQKDTRDRDPRFNSARSQRAGRGLPSLCPQWCPPRPWPPDLGSKVLLWHCRLSQAPISHSHPTQFSPEGSTQSLVPEKARTFCLSETHHILLRAPRTSPRKSYCSHPKPCMDCMPGGTSGTLQKLFHLILMALRGISFDFQLPNEKAELGEWFCPRSQQAGS